MWRHRLHAFWVMVSVAWAYGVAQWRWPRARDEVQSSVPHTFHTAALKRFRHYYLWSALLALAFEKVRRRRLNRSERHLLNHFAALSSLFDDLMEAAPEDVRNASSVSHFLSTADPDGMASLLLEQVRAQLPGGHLALFDHTLTQLFQVESTILATDAQNTNLLEQNTARKGGLAVLSFRLLLTPVPTPAEQSMWHALGGLLQHSDDLVDVWADHTNGQATMANYLLNNTSPVEWGGWWHQQGVDWQKAFHQWATREGNLRFIHHLAHAVWVIGATALEQHASTYRQKSVLPFHNRSEMIVDMEQGHHLKRALKLYFSAPVFVFNSEFSSK